MSEYEGQERRSEDGRIRRIEDVVIKLEADMSVMTKSMTDMSDAVKTLADMRLETKLLQQDYEHNKKECEEAVKDVRQSVKELRTELVSVKASSQKNTWITETISKGSWLIAGALVSFIIWIIKTQGD